MRQQLRSLLILNVCAALAVSAVAERAAADWGRGFPEVGRDDELPAQSERALSTLGLGACLADDMGLGKTMQVLALMLDNARPDQRRKDNALTKGVKGVGSGITRLFGGGDKKPKPRGQ